MCNILCAKRAPVKPKSVQKPHVGAATAMAQVWALGKPWVRDQTAVGTELRPREPDASCKPACHRGVHGGPGIRHTRRRHLLRAGRQFCPFSRFPFPTFLSHHPPNGPPSAPMPETPRGSQNVSARVLMSQIKARSSGHGSASRRTDQLSDLRFFPQTRFSFSPDLGVRTYVAATGGTHGDDPSRFLQAARSRTRVRNETTRGACVSKFKDGGVCNDSPALGSVAPRTLGHSRVCTQTRTRDTRRHVHICRSAR